MPVPPDKPLVHITSSSFSLADMDSSKLAPLDADISESLLSIIAQIPPFRARAVLDTQAFRFVFKKAGRRLFDLVITDRAADASFKTRCAVFNDAVFPLACAAKIPGRKPSGIPIDEVSTPDIQREVKQYAETFLSPEILDSMHLASLTTS
jgi:hypothetical protein